MSSARRYEGFKVEGKGGHMAFGPAVAEAVKRKVNITMIPDRMKQADVYKTEIGPNLKPGDATSPSHMDSTSTSSRSFRGRHRHHRRRARSSHLVRRTFEEGSGDLSSLWKRTGQTKCFDICARLCARPWRPHTRARLPTDDVPRSKERKERSLWRAGACSGRRSASSCRPGFEVLVEANYPARDGILRVLPARMKLIVDLCYEGGMTKRCAGSWPIRRSAATMVRRASSRKRRRRK